MAGVVSGLITDWLRDFVDSYIPLSENIHVVDSYTEDKDAVYVVDATGVSKRVLGSRCRSEVGSGWIDYPRTKIENIEKVISRFGRPTYRFKIKVRGR